MEREFDAKYNEINWDFHAMHEALRNDVRLMLNEANAPTQSIRRAVYRAQFVYMEAMVFLMKREVLLFQLHEGVELSEREIKTLTERNEKWVEDKGFITRPYHVPLAESITCTLNKYADVHWFDFEIDTRSRGWSALLHAVKVRNRVTHPKSPRDLEVTDEEVRLLKQGSTWFRNTLMTMFFECGKVYCERARALSRAKIGN